MRKKPSHSSVVITVRRIVAFSGEETPFVSTSHGDSWDVDVIFNAWTDISLLLAEDTERVIGFAPAKDVSCKGKENFQFLSQYRKIWFIINKYSNNSLLSTL